MESEWAKGYSFKEFRFWPMYIVTQFQMVSLEFFIDMILQIALWAWG